MCCPVRVCLADSHFYQRKTAFDEEAILTNLTPALRVEVVSHALKDSVGRIPLFRSIHDRNLQIEVHALGSKQSQR